MDTTPAHSPIEVPLLLPEEAARRLRISVDTLRKLIQGGLITAVKWPGNVRIDPAELARFEAQHATRSTAPPPAAPTRPSARNALQRAQAHTRELREQSR